jgi:hypothetical protein
LGGIAVPLAAFGFTNFLDVLFAAVVPDAGLRGPCV